MNGDKTKLLVLSNSVALDEKVSYEQVIIDGKVAQHVYKTKYLGNWINSWGTAKDSIDAAVKKGNIAFSMVGHLLRNKGLSIKVKATMYRVLIRPTTKMSSGILQFLLVF